MNNARKTVQRNILPVDIFFLLKKVAKKYQVNLYFKKTNLTIFFEKQKTI